MRPRTWLPWLALGVMALALALTAGLFVGNRRTAIPGGHSSAPSTVAAPRAPSMPYSLLTHCGIDEARIDQTYYEADHPLVGPGYDPPLGWTNPYESGTMTLLSPSRAVFRDDAGHEVYFHVRAGATAFKQLCD